MDSLWSAGSTSLFRADTLSMFPRTRVVRNSDTLTTSSTTNPSAHAPGPRSNNDNLEYDRASSAAEPSSSSSSRRRTPGSNGIGMANMGRAQDYNNLARASTSSTSSDSTTVADRLREVTKRISPVNNISPPKSSQLSLQAQPSVPRRLFDLDTVSEAGTVRGGVDDEEARREKESLPPLPSDLDSDFDSISRKPYPMKSNARPATGSDRFRAFIATLDDDDTPNNQRNPPTTPPRTRVRTQSFPPPQQSASKKATLSDEEVDSIVSKQICRLPLDSDPGHTLTHPQS
ncbi:hypothetical protein DL93DRAFT_821761 [Clavulina sp. PMI_390]|nr:hypothetical protein DL93DRAFT_821761 [Clavulina sp. PMI_390]